MAEKPATRTVGHVVRQAHFTLVVLAAPLSLAVLIVAGIQMTALDWQKGETEYIANIIYIVWGVLSLAYSISYLLVTRLKPTSFYISLILESVFLSLLCLFSAAGVVTGMMFMLKPGYSFYFANPNLYKACQPALLALSWILFATTLSTLLLTTLYTHTHFERSDAVWAKSFSRIIADDTHHKLARADSGSRLVIDDDPEDRSGASHDGSVIQRMVQPFPSPALVVEPASSAGEEGLPPYYRVDPVLEQRRASYNRKGGPSRVRPRGPNNIEPEMAQTGGRETGAGVDTTRGTGAGGAELVKREEEMPDDLKFEVLQLDR